MKGLRLKNELSVPLVYNDSRYAFLARIVEWLDIWRMLPGKCGKLRTQIFTSLKQACIGVATSFCDEGAIASEEKN